MIDSGIGPPGYHQKYYSERDWRRYTELLSRIIRFSNPGPVLDLGAGCGFLVEAAHLWGIEAKGLEGSPEAVDIAKKRVPDLDIRTCSLSQPLPVANETFQTVVLNQVIEHLEKNTSNLVAREALRVLRPGGMLVITAPSIANRTEATADPTHINLMTPKELRELLIGAGFERVVAFDYTLPFLGRNRACQRIADFLFRLCPIDRISATTNVMAFKNSKQVK